MSFEEKIAEFWKGRDDDAIKWHVVEVLKGTSPLKEIGVRTLMVEAKKRGLTR